MHRLFVAIELPGGVKDKLIPLRTDIPAATWVKRDALHLTLKFLGDDIPTPKLDVIRTALAGIALPAFTLYLTGVGRFPADPKRSARVLWVALSDQPLLEDLAEAVEARLEPLGFPREARGFSPHITLARLKNDRTPPEVAHFLETRRGFRSDPFTVAQFVLFSSKLTPQGAIYTPEAIYPLKSDA